MQFLKIAITPPDFIADESKYIEIILENGFDYVHIRKPGASEEDVARLIGNINEKFHPYLRLHDHFCLLNKYNLGGIQINSRNMSIPSGVHSISKSCHSVEECINGYDAGYDYTTLSPIYDSISKQGYKSHFILEEIANRIRNKNVVAMGGVAPEHMQELMQYGFAGMAMLGYLFSSESLEELNKRLKKLK